MTPSTLLSPLLTYCADLPGFSRHAIEVAETEQRIATVLSALTVQTELLFDANAQLNAMRKDRDALLARIAELEPLAECAAIMAVSGYFSRMRGPDVWLHAGSWDEYPELFACAGVDLRSFQHGTRFYAGSAPVPAAQAVDVDAICNAYESGVGHRGRPTANVNPYRECTPEHEAYAIGAKGEAAQAEAKVADGWVLVPREPTEEMVLAALKEVDPLRELIDWTDGHGFMREDARRAWSAMLAAKAKGG